MLLGLFEKRRRSHVGSLKTGVFLEDSYIWKVRATQDSLVVLLFLSTSFLVCTIYLNVTFTSEVQF